MPANGPVGLDVLIFGGGAAGLWLLDDLARAGYRVLLLEAEQLGAGQTVASQGIIHGGLKYSLGGLLTSSARAVRDMPGLWRRCLAGEAEPDLSGTRRRAEYCHLWRTTSLTSRAAMIGARAGLRIAPVTLTPDARPAALRECPGLVARLDEQVIEPSSLISTLADRRNGRILRIDAGSGLEIDHGGPGRIEVVKLINPDTGDPLDLAPEHVVLTAGAGNDDLRHRIGLERPRMQRRPLHMVVARGNLPVVNGHCVDGLQTRATITTTHDYANRIVWQIGGRLAEDGVGMDRATLVDAARRELTAILPGVAWEGVEWSTYAVDRAEMAARGGVRPEGIGVRQEGRTITGWPTKLVLVPQLVAAIRSSLPPPRELPPVDNAMLKAWPRPGVAAPPWDERLEWTSP